MRLKQREHTFVAAARRRFQRGAYFRRMMPVIVDQRDARMHAFHLKSPAHPGKLRQPRANQVGGNIDRQPHGGGSSRVAHVMNTGG